MPTYEYRCRECGEHLEAVQAFTDDALTECPACGGLLRKVFGSVGIAFKGSGFYRNDSRTGSSSSSTSSSKDKEPAASSTSTSSSSDSSSSTSSSKDTKSSSSSSTSTGSSTAAAAAS